MSKLFVIILSLKILMTDLQYVFYKPQTNDIADHSMLYTTCGYYWAA